MLQHSSKRKCSSDDDESSSNKKSKMGIKKATLGLTTVNPVDNESFQWSQIKIFILAGLIQELTIGTVAHEYLHAYFFEKEIDIPDKVEEGICEALCYMTVQEVKVQQSPESVGAMHKDMEKNTDPVYGIGFREAMRALDAYGLSQTLDHIVAHGSFPKPFSTLFIGTKITETIKNRLLKGMEGEGPNSFHAKAVEAFEVSSEEELKKVIDEIACILLSNCNPEKHIEGLRKIEGILVGGAGHNFPCFSKLLEKLIGPLTKQLNNERGIIVKQALHLLNVLSEKLSIGFRGCVKGIIPALLKKLENTVIKLKDDLEMAKEIDKCITKLLGNCESLEMLPLVAEFTKSTHPLIRARGCEYALVLLKHCRKTKVHRYKELCMRIIRTCARDEMSETRDTASLCYQRFKKVWTTHPKGLSKLFEE